MSEPGNHIATAAEIRAAAESEAYEPPERVVLPKSGFPIIVRRPRALAYALAGGPLPQSVAAKLAKEAGSATLSEEDQLAITQRFARVFVASIVKPKFSFEPGFDEVSPAWLPEEDQRFLTRFIGGEIDARGNDLVEFRSKPEPRSADSRPDGGDVELAAEPASA